VLRPAASGLVLALALLSSPGSDEPVGFVQFKSGPGVRIDLDGRQAGVTNGKDGLIARSVRPGARLFSAHREGFVPQFGMVLVEPDVVTLKQLDAWQPVIQAEIDRRQGVGTLIVETLPVESTILARRLGWKDKVEKGEGPFIARELPAGSHRFTFCTEFKCIDYSVPIPAAGVTKLLIDFEPGHIFDVSKEFAAGWRGAEKRCDRDRDRASCKLACETDSALRPAAPSPACSTLNGGEPAIEVVHAASSFTPPPIEDPCGIEAGSGFLTVTSHDVVQVLLGETSLGYTPLQREAIASGCHQLVAVTRDGRRHTISIRVQPNEERRIKLTF
jgi:hypothetical protein